MNSQKELIKKATELIKDIYGFNGVGGNCHIVIDDYNIDDESIDWCLIHVLSSNVHEHTEKQLTIEKECLEVLKALSISNRKKVFDI